MRIAIVSTPRSGNTWLRLMLAETFGLHQLGVHRPSDVQWSLLPENVVLQIHWHRTNEFLNQLRSHGFSVITIARHPLDVLLSILQFCGNEPQTAFWLDGKDGNEMQIIGASPAGSNFLAYCLSKRAAALLGVSADWWGCPQVVCVRYEDLVTDCDSTMAAITSKIGGAPDKFVNDVDKFSIQSLRAISRNNHFWKGTPGLWQRLFLDGDAQIAMTQFSQNWAIDAIKTWTIGLVAMSRLSLSGSTSLGSSFI
jgi:hypothetical protein